MRAWIKAARPLAFGNIAPPLIVGQALAYALTGRFAWGAFAFAMAFGAVDLLFIVFANDYADRAADADNPSPTPFSGGSRVLVDGDLQPRQLRRAAVAAAVGLLGLGASGAWFWSSWLLPLSVAALLLLWAYSFPPLRMSYRGHGEWLQGAGLGAVLPAVGYVVQAGGLGAFPWALLAPLVLLGTAGNLVTSLPDEQADRRASKRSHAARHGGARTQRRVVQGIALSAALLPFCTTLSSAALAVVIAPALGLLLGQVWLARRSGQADSSAVLLSVVLFGAAITWLQLSLAVALLLGERG